MRKRHQRQRPAESLLEKSDSTDSSSRKRRLRIIAVVLTVVAAVIIPYIGLTIMTGGRLKEIRSLSPVPAASSNSASINAPLPTNEVAQAIMVTVELDFGGKPPSIKDALKEIERSYEPKG